MSPRHVLTGLSLVVLIVAACGADVEVGGDGDAVAEAPDAWDVAEAGGPDEGDAEASTDADADSASPNDAGPEVTPTSCGDGVVDPGEACDDGNTDEGDWCSADCLALVDVTSPTAYAPHTSYQVLTTSNGLAAAMFAVTDLDAQPQNKVTAFRDHLYSAYDEGVPSRDWLWDLYFGYRASGVSSAGTWLDQVPVQSAAYAVGTNVVEVVQQAAGLRFESRWFAPFHAPDGADNELRALVGVVQVTNTTTAPIPDVAVFSLVNVHVGGEGDSADEAVAWDAEHAVLTEQRGERRFVYRNLVAEHASHTADNGGDVHNPWRLVSEGQHFSNYVEATPSDDIAVGFENRVDGGAALAPGASRWFGLVVATSDQHTTAQLAAQVDAFVAGRTPEAIVQAELAWWDTWHAAGPPPAALTPDEAALWRQSTAILKMGQVRETAASGCPSGKCFGQILASLVPGQWNISWVRDASYAIAGLVRAGHFTEARDALAFMLLADLLTDGPDNHYQKHFIESTDPAPGTWGLGVPLSAPYAISLTRYFGRGLEESDANAAGPNLEWDNWGLFLWAFADYVEASGDEAFLAEHWGTVSDQVADLLLDLIDPDLALLVPDSSIWERHWCPHGQCPEPDTRKHFTYSTLNAIHGLERAAALATAVGDAEREGLYLAGAQTLRAGVRAHLVVTPPATGLPALAGNLEEIPYPVYYLDVSVIEAVNFGVVPPGDPLAFGTLAAFDAYLAMGPHSPGFRRTDDGTWYDAQEWVVVDLRLASALTRMGQLGRARTLLDWVTGQAHANGLIIGELLSDGVYQPGSEDERWQPGTDAGGDYQGAIPMCGFGPGAWILAVSDLYAATP